MYCIYIYPWRSTPRLARVDPRLAIFFFSRGWFFLHAGFPPSRPARARLASSFGQTLASYHRRRSLRPGGPSPESAAGVCNPLVCTHAVTCSSLSSPVPG